MNLNVYEWFRYRSEPVLDGVLRILVIVGLFAAGLKLLERPAIWTGIVGSALITWGIQTLLWTCGIELEILGTTPSPINEVSKYQAVPQQAVPVEIRPADL